MPERILFIVTIHGNLYYLSRSAKVVTMSVLGPRFFLCRNLRYLVGRHRQFSCVG